MDADGCPIDSAVRFAVQQPGWADRVMRDHRRGADGSCTGCGGYRLVRWPCVLIHIAVRAQQLPRGGA